VTSLEGARGYERFGFFLPIVVSHVFLAWCYAELGLFAESLALCEEGLQIAEAVAHAASIMFASWGFGVLCLRQGDLSKALPQLERAMGICHEADLPALFPRIASALSVAYILAGRVADAVPLFTQAQAKEHTTAREGELVGLQTLYHLSLGEAHLLAGHLKEAHYLAERALALACEHQERGNQAYALRLLGDFAARREPPEIALAETHYHQALTLAEELGMRPLQAHCHRGLGTLYATTGQREPARTELSTAMEMYQSMDMTFWLPRTEAAIAQVEGQ
jgi:tetratricopeptide (TPR) repeat protein